MPVTRHDLRRMRKAAGYNQGELAKIIGISAPFVSHIEIGTRRITLELLNAWCAACDRSLSALGTGQADARAAVDLLDEVDSSLVARISTVLPMLEPAHRATLINMLELWENWVASGNLGEAHGGHQSDREVS